MDDCAGPSLGQLFSGIVLVLLTLLVVGARAHGAAGDQPVLRIDPGGHTAAIWRLATDGHGRWLATASDDKTVRVWEIATGHLVRTLRAPFTGDQTRFYAVAMSPDGDLVAAGGWTTTPGEAETIYVFRRSDGSLRRRLGAPVGSVLDLAWSSDGRYLAATTRTAVWVYSAPDFTLLGRDTDCNRPSKSVDFDRTGRLVTSCHDGRIRLYEIGAGGLRRAASEPAPGGRLPSSARFSPDGTRIAVGYEDSPRVSVLRADTLAVDVTPDSRELTTGYLWTVAWSADGGLLFAAGSRPGDGLIRRWSGSGRGSYADLATGSGRINDLRALAGGALVFGSSDPSWGVLDPAGKRVRSREHWLADFTAPDRLRVSADGLRVAFDYEGRGGVPAQFDVASRVLALGDPAADLLAPRTTAPGLEFTRADWQNTREPKLRGQRLEIREYETSNSLAIAPDGQRFVLGTSWYLRLFDRSGRLLQPVVAPSSPVAVNITGDGRHVVAGFRDGTIRWYSIADGSERLAFFPHADRKRWVLWTPSGYYDASPGGEELIGWQVDRGPAEAADFFPASRFRSAFYRPDVLARVLEAGGEAEAARLANVETGRRPQSLTVLGQLPPVVEILSPPAGTTVSGPAVTVKFRVRTPPDAPATEVRARVNGRLLPLPALPDVLDKGTGLGEITVPVTARESEIAIVARNRHEWSAPGVVSVVVPAALSAPAASPTAVLYVLAVGISKYENQDLRLDYAAKDAQDFVAVVARQKGRLYRDVQVRHIPEQDATATEIRRGLAWLRREVTAQDVGMLFFAGHGDEDADGRYYFLPVNVDVRSLFSSAVPESDITQVLGTLAGKAIFFMDTCRAGRVAEPRRRRGSADTHRIINELAATQNATVVYASSTGRQFSWEDPAWGNGAFTKALVEGLGGRAADPATRKITHQMLGVYLSNRVKELTDGNQHPVPRIEGAPDFPIAIAPD